MKVKIDKETIVWMALCLAAIIAMFLFGGCRSTSKVEYVNRDVIKTDTTTIYKTDTIKDVQIIFDSVREYIRDSSWIDSLGRIHHDRLVREIRETDRYKNLYESAMEKINHMSESDSSNVSTLVEYRDRDVIKKVYVWWPFVVITALFMVGAGYISLKIKNK